VRDEALVPYLITVPLLFRPVPSRSVPFRPVPSRSVPCRTSFHFGNYSRSCMHVVDAIAKESRGTAHGWSRVNGKTSSRMKLEGENGI
jgi:hypothetical protein